MICELDTICCQMILQQRNFYLLKPFIFFSFTYLNHYVLDPMTGKKVSNSNITIILRTIFNYQSLFVWKDMENQTKTGILHVMFCYFFPLKNI